MAQRCPADQPVTQAQEERSCTVLRNFGGLSQSTGHPLSSQVLCDPTPHLVPWGFSCRPWKNRSWELQLLGLDALLGTGPSPSPCFSNGSGPCVVTSIAVGKGVAPRFRILLALQE